MFHVDKRGPPSSPSDFRLPSHSFYDFANACNDETQWAEERRRVLEALTVPNTIEGIDRK